MTTSIGVFALGLILLVTGVAAGGSSEPPHVEGHWVGTWWMGKYEEPIEMELVQRGAVVSGRIAMLGYPSDDSGTQSSENALIQDGRLDGERLVLMWRIGGRRLTATLVVTRPGTLSGLGSEDGQVTAGFGLSRVR